MVSVPKWLHYVSGMRTVHMMICIYALGGFISASTMLSENLFGILRKASQGTQNIQGKKITSDNSNSITIKCHSLQFEYYYFRFLPCEGEPFVSSGSTFTTTIEDSAKKQNNALNKAKRNRIKIMNKHIKE